jgi:glycosyltransferase involved in cell wall biosynthesis
MSDRLGGKSVVYFGLYDPVEVPGVHQKVLGVLAAAEAAGSKTRWHAERFSKMAPVRRLADAIDAAPESLIILRSLGWANLFLLPALQRARRRGCAVVVDVPSPNRVAVLEIWRSRQSLWRRARTVALFYLSGPWALWPATRIVQYAPESWWFRIGNTARTVEIGNGINVAAIEPRPSAPAWPAPTLRVIAVAAVARWHGYDRLLRAIKAFVDRGHRPFDLHLTIVGDGPALDPIRQLAASLGLRDRVAFAGTVTGSALRDLYSASHLAVSSIGLHRIGLSSASVLKAREYCATGIPFIASGADPDFPGDVPFRFTVSASEETGDIVAAFEAFARGYAAIDAQAMRQYAVAHLDWRHKAAAFGVGG